MASKKQIYLDHAATTPVHGDVLGAMLPYFGYHYGNASGFYSLGQRSKTAIEDARKHVADLIGAEPREIIFTSGGTEADNLAIQGSIFANVHKGRHIITSAIEHHAVLNVCTFLEQRGFRVSYLPVDQYGAVRAAEVKKAITNDTIMITIMHSNNEVGTLQPIAEIGAIAKEHGIIFHSDAVQSVGKIGVDVNDLNVDFMSISAHKIYGPKGIGALYVRQGNHIAPLMHGGDHEMKMRPGTENVPAIVGFGKACEIAAETLEANLSQVKELREQLEKAISEKLPSARINAHPKKQLPHILSVSFESLESLSIIANLDIQGICASGGAACTTGIIEPSHVLSAMQIPPEMAYGTVRFSLGWENNPREIEMTATALAIAIKRLQSFYQSNPEEICVITFPKIEQARAAQKVSLKSDVLFSLIATPQHILLKGDAHVALAHLDEDHERIMTLLGETGIEITGTHRIRGVSRAQRGKVMKDKEKQFWDRVSKIKKI